MNFTKYTLALVAIILISACSKDKGTNPDDNLEFFPGAPGNYWVYEGYAIDEDDEKIPNSDYRDSVYYSGTEVHLEKQAKIFTTLRAGAMSFDDYFHYDAEAKILYSRESFVLPNADDFNLPLDFIPEQWIELVNQNTNTWTVMPEVTSSAMDFDMQGFAGKLTVKYKINGRKASTEQIVIAGKTYTAQIYTLENVINGNFTPNNPPIPIPITNFTIYVNLYMVEGIGIVRTYTEPSQITLLAYELDFPGSNKVLVSHK